MQSRNQYVYYGREHIRCTPYTHCNVYNHTCILVPLLYLNIVTYYIGTTYMYIEVIAYKLILYNMGLIIYIYMCVCVLYAI